MEINLGLGDQLTRSAEEEEKFLALRTKIFKIYFRLVTEAQSLENYFLWVCKFSGLILVPSGPEVLA